MMLFQEMPAATVALFHYIPREYYSLPLGSYYNRCLDCMRGQGQITYMGSQVYQHTYVVIPLQAQDGLFKILLIFLVFNL